MKALRPITKVEIFSLDGLLIESQNQNFENLNIENLKNGMYLVKVHFVNSQQTTKFIKQ
ncbi:MAG: T9SS type A sorting domain-containing protein [Bacteroidia bacterium]|nr:T9SS type A sorting domain-containing protein [Bacteroidia bacterium]